MTKDRNILFEYSKTHAKPFTTPLCVYGGGACVCVCCIEYVCNIHIYIVQVENVEYYRDGLLCAS